MSRKRLRDLSPAEHEALILAQVLQDLDDARWPADANLHLWVTCAVISRRAFGLTYTQCCAVVERLRVLRALEGP